MRNMFKGDNMKKIQVLGIELCDYTIREAMKKIDEYMHDGRIDAIGYITTKGLMEANGRPELKEWMHSLDMTISADGDILHAANIDAAGRLREVEENAFMKEFLKKLARNRRSVFVLTETKEQLGELTKVLLDYQEHLKIVGTYAMEELQADEDYVVNEINIVTPHVLISQLPSPRREEFFKNNRLKVNTEIWLMLKDGMRIGNQHKNLWYRFYRYMTNKIFKSEVDRFKKEADS